MEQPQKPPPPALVVLVPVLVLLPLVFVVPQPQPGRLLVLWVVRLVPTLVLLPVLLGVLTNTAPAQAATVPQPGVKRAPNTATKVRGGQKKRTSITEVAAPLTRVQGRTKAGAPGPWRGNSQGRQTAGVGKIAGNGQLHQDDPERQARWPFIKRGRRSRASEAPRWPVWQGWDAVSGEESRVAQESPAQGTVGANAFVVRIDTC